MGKNNGTAPGLQVGCLQIKFISELAAAADQAPHEWLFDALVQTRLDMSMAVFVMSEENRLQEIRFPVMMIGTD